MRRSCFGCAAAVVLTALLSGCGPEPVMKISYDRPAQYEVPASIVSLGIAEFAGQTDEDRRWGNIAADQLAAELDKYNKQFNRYKLVDRKRLKAILDEQDLQAAFSDSSKALEAGKLAQVDAMIYGTASVSVKDDVVSKSTFNPLSQSMSEKSYTRRCVVVAINFTIDDVKSSSTLTTVSAMKEYDSDNAGGGSGGKAVLGAMGLSSNKAQAADQVTVDLVNQCVAEFLQKISPHQITFTEKLAGGSSEHVKTGNKLALAGNCTEALELYMAGLAAKPADHEAMFNAGVMYEKLGQLDKAQVQYDQAMKLKPKEQYILARERVRREVGAAKAPVAMVQPG